MKEEEAREEIKGWAIIWGGHVVQPPPETIENASECICEEKKYASIKNSIKASLLVES